MGRRTAFGSIIMATARATMRGRRLAAAAALRAEKDAVHEARLSERAQDQNQRKTVLQSGPMRGPAASHALEKARKEDYVKERKAEAGDINETLRDYLQSLDALLESTTHFDKPLSFDELRILQEPEPFKASEADLSPAPRPSLDEYHPETPEPKGITSLLPGAKQRWHGRVALASAEVYADYDEAMTHWMEQERARLERLTAQELDYAIRYEGIERKKRLHDRGVEEFEADYRRGDRDAVATYIAMVLERSLYPDNFPQNFSVTFGAKANLVVVDYELPSMDAIPKTFEVQYIQSNDQIVSIPVRKQDRTAIYQEVMAAIALRTLHEIFATDQTGLIFNICFNGYVKTTDPETGGATSPHLLSVKVTKPEFARIDLMQADKRTCLRGWGAILSRQPDEAVPIQPIVDIEMADRRAAGSADAARMTKPIELVSLGDEEFKSLVHHICKSIGFESIVDKVADSSHVECLAYDERPALGPTVMLGLNRGDAALELPEVRAFFDALLAERANTGLLVTDGTFDRQSTAFASDKPLELIDGKGLTLLARDLGIDLRLPA